MRRKQDDDSRVTIAQKVSSGSCKRISFRDRDLIQGGERNGEHGFTLIEIMLVLVIIAILLAVGVATFLDQQDKAHATAIEVQLTDAAHSATYEFTSHGQGIFPTNTIASMQHSEPELNIVCGAAYVKNQISAYFKDTNDCAPSAGAHVLDLRGVSDDDTDYVIQLDYTRKERDVLKLKGDDTDTVTNYAENPGMERFTGDPPQPNACGWQVVASDPPVISHQIVSSPTMGGEHSLQITVLDLNTLLAEGSSNAYSTAHCGAVIDSNEPITIAAWMKAPAGARIQVRAYRRLNGLPPWDTNYPAGVPAASQSCNSTPAASGDWQQVACTIAVSNPALGTTTSIETRTGFYATGRAGLANGMSVYIDDWSVNIGTDALPYFDGSYPDAVWNNPSQPNTSTSSGYAWDTW